MNRHLDILRGLFVQHVQGNALFKQQKQPTQTRETLQGNAPFNQQIEPTQTRETLIAQIRTLRSNINSLRKFQTFKYNLINKATEKVYKKLYSKYEFHDNSKHHYAIERAYFYMHGFFKHVQNIFLNISESAFSEEPGASIDYARLAKFRFSLQ